MQNKRSNKRSKKIRPRTGNRIVPVHTRPPRSTTAVVVYTKSVDMTESVVNQGVAAAFRMNAAYDVDPTVLSTSAPGFNEYAAFWSRYRVMRCRATVHGIATGISQICLITAPFGAYSLPTPAASTWGVQRNSFSKVCNQISGQSYYLVDIEGQWDLWKVANVPKSVYRNSMNFSALTGSTPSDMYTLSVAGHGIASGAAIRYFLQVTIAMEVEFTDPKLLSV